MVEESAYRPESRRIAGQFSAAATAMATQDIYLTLQVTNGSRGNWSKMTWATGKMTLRAWGGVAQ